jgi:hypothetical protein
VIPPKLPAVNKDNPKASEVQQKVAQGVQIDLRQPGAELKDCFDCPFEALHVCKMMLDNMPGVENLRRDTEARTRTVLVDKVAVDETCLTSGKTARETLPTTPSLSYLHRGRSPGLTAKEFIKRRWNFLGLMAPPSKKPC